MTADELTAGACLGSGSLVFAEPWWLDAVAPGGWCEATATLPTGASARLPYVEMNAFGRFRAIASPPLTPRLGPQLSVDMTARRSKLYSDKKSLVTQLIEALPAHGYFAQSCSPYFDYWLPFHWAGYEQTSYYSYIIDDLSDEAAIWRHMSKSHRRRITRGERDYSIRDDLGVDVLLPLIEQTFKRQGLVSGVDPKLLRRAHEAAAANNSGEILVALDVHDRPVAGGFFVSDSDATYYLLGGRGDGADDDNGMPLVLWNAIQRAAKVSRRFDFEGSMIEGIEEFFRRFGARPEPYSFLSRSTPIMELARTGRHAIGEARQQIAARSQRR